jgi:hypothetical protein|uniref:Uncharacterized protein n=1 Tax=viral metagenome TaxID=1070528 RepID=A0A6C0BZF2_9ZZZZ
MIRIIISSLVIGLVAIKLLLYLKDSIVRKLREGFSFNYNLCYNNFSGKGSCGPGARNAVCRCKDKNLGVKISGYEHDCMCPQSTYPNFY